MAYLEVSESIAKKLLKNDLKIITYKQLTKACPKTLDSQSAYRQCKSRGKRKGR